MSLLPDVLAANFRENDTGKEKDTELNGVIQRRDIGEVKEDANKIGLYFGFCSSEGLCGCKKSE